ncbi:hypothetical protein CI109_102025 [Kwoniella shandongensis]|uniref:Ureidoglycolate hydrolase n=1 Tax=Kwoniella shandongensis TaxID=1734106 RepID=A0AAJ8LGV7_9TREE
MFYVASAFVMSIRITAVALTPSTTHARLHIISPALTTSKTRHGNQGTSTKTPYIAPCTNNYDTAPSGQSGRPLLSASRNTPRTISKDVNGSQSLVIHALERHPYTSQSFTPMGRKADTAYIVVVADGDESGQRPDLTTVKAYTVPGDTGVCYDAGLWHAPMAVVGEVRLLGDDFPLTIRPLTLPSSNLRTASQRKTAK